MDRREFFRNVTRASIVLAFPLGRSAHAEDKAQLISSFDSDLSALVANEQALDILRQTGPSEGAAFLRGILTHAIVGRRKSDKAISERAVNLIVVFEVTSEKHYQRALQGLIWPHGKSGPTMGIGYDIGYVNKATFGDDWAAYIDNDRISRISSGCRLTGHAAQDFVKRHQDIKVDWSEAINQFNTQMIPFLVGETLAALPKNAERLSPDSLGAICSLVYNRGASFQVVDDRHAEMRNIRRLIAQGAFAKVPGEIRSMKRIWEGDPNMRGLVARRELEAKLFEAGL